MSRRCKATQNGGFDQRDDVVPGAGKEVVDANHLAVFLQQPGAKVAPEQTSSPVTSRLNLPYPGMSLLKSIRSTTTRGRSDGAGRHVETRGHRSIGAHIEHVTSSVQWPLATGKSPLTACSGRLRCGMSVLGMFGARGMHAREGSSSRAGEKT